MNSESEIVLMLNKKHCSIIENMINLLNVNVSKNGYLWPQKFKIGVAPVCFVSKKLPNVIH